MIHSYGQLKSLSRPAAVMSIFLPAVCCPNWKTETRISKRQKVDVQWNLGYNTVCTLCDLTSMHSVLVQLCVFCKGRGKQGTNVWTSLVLAMLESLFSFAICLLAHFVFCTFKAADDQNCSSEFLAWTVSLSEHPQFLCQVCIFVSLYSMFVDSHFFNTFKAANDHNWSELWDRLSDSWASINFCKVWIFVFLCNMFVCWVTFSCTFKAAHDHNWGEFWDGLWSFN